MTDMSDDSVLVMDWIEGIPLSNRERLEAVGVDRAGLARGILHAYGVMIFQSDLFHADPHPGNIIALKDGRLGLVDFGEVGSVTPADRSVLLRMMSAVLGRDGDALAEAVLSVSRTTRGVDRAEFGAHLTALLHPIADASLKDVRLGDVLGPLLHLLRSSGIVLPSAMAILIKTMIECEATTGELDPTLSMLNLVGELASFAPTPGPTAREATSASHRTNSRARRLRFSDRRMTALTVGDLRLLTLPVARKRSSVTPNDRTTCRLRRTAPGTRGRSSPTSIALTANLPGVIGPSDRGDLDDDRGSSTGQGWICRCRAMHRVVPAHRLGDVGSTIGVGPQPLNARIPEHSKEDTSTVRVPVL